MCPSGSVCADGNCVPAQVHALHPPLVDGTSGTIVLEGAFGATATVAFPGAAMPVPATVLGPSRLRVDVPASATAGSLVVNSAGSTATTAQRFRRASFRLGLQPFRSRYEQADYARQTPSLGTARVRAASVHTGAWLYVIGGADTRGEALDSIERAMINADGTLGAFQANAVGLGAAREGAAAIRVGGGVYLLGGAARGAAVRTVERAAVNTSGMLDAFVSLSAEAAPLALRTARSGLVAEVIGGYVYVFGGGTMDVERAPIRTDGTLGAFATVVGVTTRARRTRPTIQVVGGFVYLMGGSDGGVALQTVERAAISADGDLGDFALTESLTVARDGAASVVLGNRVYVAGGAGAAGALDSIEYAESMPDGGALGPFVAVPSATNRLSTARGGAASTVVGNYWYLVGGASAAPLAGIDRAEINASGVFGTPRNLPAPGLAGPRILPTAVAIGRYIYVLGGSGPDGFDDTRGTERAPVLDDGSLGAFVGYPPVSAATQYRAGAEVAVIGASLYVFGGRRNTSTFLETALRMQILDDGSLGPPSTTFSGTTLTFGRAMVLSDRVCVFGGTHGGGTSDTIGCARINASGALEPFAAQAVQLPGVRNYAAGALINDNVYLLGGTNGSAILDSIVRCVVPGDVSSCALHERRLSRPIQLPFGAMIGNALIYAGGQSSAGVRFGTDLERVPILADSVGGGATVAGVVLPLGLYYHSTLVIDNTLWLLGGETALGIARSHQVVELR